MYSTWQLPTEDALRRDLTAMLDTYDEAIVIKRSLLLERPGAIATPSDTSPPPASDPLLNFRPKSDADYCTTLRVHR